MRAQAIQVTAWLCDPLDVTPCSYLRVRRRTAGFVSGCDARLRVPLSPSRPPRLGVWTVAREPSEREAHGELGRISWRQLCLQSQDSASGS